MENYYIAKDLFLKGRSLRSIGEELCINRKKLSLMLRRDGVHTDKSISMDDINKAIKMIQQGNKITVVANKINVDRHTLSKQLEKLNIRKPQKYKRIITEHDNQIESLYLNENLSIDKISNKLGISTNAIWNCLLEKGINDPNRKAFKYTYNDDLFDDISTEWEAYWLGFLYADGYVDIHGSSIELCLQKRDEGHVKKFMRYVSPDKRNSYDKSINGHIQHRIDIYSKKLTNNLVKSGCINNKTFVLQFPGHDIVPEHLMHHFMRGFFDGDGCVCLSKNRTIFSIGGASYSFMSDFQDYLIEHASINRTKLHNKRNVYTFSNASKSSINNLYNYLYNDATIFLKRKHLKFKSRMQMPS